MTGSIIQDSVFCPAWSKWLWFRLESSLDRLHLLHSKCKSENINEDATARCIKRKDQKCIKSTDSTQLLGCLNLLSIQATNHCRIYNEALPRLNVVEVKEPGTRGDGYLWLWVLEVDGCSPVGLDMIGDHTEGDVRPASVPHTVQGHTGLNKVCVQQSQKQQTSVSKTRLEIQWLAFRLVLVILQRLRLSDVGSIMTGDRYWTRLGPDIKETNS